MTKKIKAVLIDDSAQARKLLRLMLLEYAPNIEIIGEAELVDEGLSLIEKFVPDAVFLDIEMPGKTGLQLAEKLLELAMPCSVVFTTAYNVYALQAFRLAAVDYLLKPIQENQLIEAIEKLESQKTTQENLQKLKALNNNLNSKQIQQLCIPVQGGSQYVPLDELLYLEADGSYVKVITVDGKVRLVSKNLKYFESALQDNSNFVRAHRSFLVNMNHLVYHAKSEGGILHLKNGVQVPISRERKQAVLQFLEKR